MKNSNFGTSSLVTIGTRIHVDDISDCSLTLTSVGEGAKQTSKVDT